jgi:MFS family permease
MRSYTAIYAVLYVFFSIGAGVGPLVFGWSFDQTGSYRLILDVAFVVLIASGVSLLTLGRYRYKRQPDSPLPAAAAPATLPNVVAAQSPIAGR